MKILVDENIPAITVAELKKQGHDVLDVRGTKDQGLTDKALWQRALVENRMFITTDKGFSEHRDENHNGILIIRLKQPTRDKIHQRIFQALQQYPDGNWSGLFVVMRDSFQSSWRSKSI